MNTSKNLKQGILKNKKIKTNLCEKYSGEEGNPKGCRTIETKSHGFWREDQVINNWIIQLQHYLQFILEQININSTKPLKIGKDQLHIMEKNDKEAFNFWKSLYENKRSHNRECNMDQASWKCNGSTPYGRHWDNRGNSMKAIRGGQKLECCWITWALWILA